MVVTQNYSSMAGKSGVGYVLFDTGNFLVGHVELKSQVHLWVDGDVVIWASVNASGIQDTEIMMYCTIVISFSF